MFSCTKQTLMFYHISQVKCNIVSILSAFPSFSRIINYDGCKRAPWRDLLKLITKIDICLSASNSIKYIYTPPTALLLHNIYCHKGLNRGATIDEKFVCHSVVITVRYAIPLEIETINIYRRLTPPHDDIAC